MTAPELPHAPEADAVGAPVEQPVRPLVERLRQVRRATRWMRGLDVDYPVAWETDPLCQEAATEIERLRACLREVLEFQSDPKAPTIHDFGRWRRAAEGLKA